MCRSLVNYNLNDYDAALSDAEKSLVLDPAWMKGFHRRGLALLALNRNEEAQAAYEQALKLQPHNKVIKSCLKKVMIVVAVVLVFMCFECQHHMRRSCRISMLKTHFFAWLLSRQRKLLPPLLLPF